MGVTSVKLHCKKKTRKKTVIFWQQGRQKMSVKKRKNTVRKKTVKNCKKMVISYPIIMVYYCYSTQNYLSLSDIMLIY
jgi:sulfur relay (sulfurtransferase) DsrF/TusC family protein